MRFSRRLSTLVTLPSLSSAKQWLHCFNQLLSFLFISLPFYLSVSSSFHRAFQARFIECFKLISSDVSSLFLLNIERFKLISSDVSSLFLLVECHWSRLTSDSGLLHRRACSFHVIIADSLQVPFKQTHYRVTSSVNEVNRCCLIRACYMHVAELVSFVSTTRM